MIDAHIAFNWFVSIAGFAVIIAVAIVYLKSEVRKEHAEELKELAETRGQTIEDQDKRIQQLEQKVAALAGEVKAMQALQSEYIADLVVEKLEDKGVI